MHHMEHTQASRRIGRAAALALVFFGVMYAIITIVGLLSLKSPQEPIPDPFFFLMEVLIVVTAPLYVAVMVAVYAFAERSVKVYGLMALIFMSVCAAITTSVHFVMLTVSRQLYEQLCSKLRELLYFIPLTNFLHLTVEGHVNLLAFFDILN